MKDYPISDISLTFSEYITRCRSLIEERRVDLQQNSNAKLIIDANSPFELVPHQANQSKCGALLIHGLLDSPFSLRDISLRLQANGVLCRAILLPGHGTIPSDLLHVSYHDWIQTVRYGIESLRRDVEHIFLVGYSTGAALSLYHALNDPKISGIILLAPAIRIKAPVDIVVGWHRLLKLLRQNRQWLYCEEEVDYTKYQSIGFNPVKQVSDLTNVIVDLKQQRSINCPIFMVVSREDETISSHSAIDFFTNLPNRDNKLLLYTSLDHLYPDPRIVTRQTHDVNLFIKHFSHVCIPFAPNNPHYGQNGDYSHSSRLDSGEIIYGAYNRIEVNIFHLLYKLGIVKQKRRELTFNPDFDFMAKMISEFILESSIQKQDNKAKKNHTYS